MRSGKERLHALAKFLRTVPESKFDLNSWADFKRNAQIRPGTLTAETIKATCGTTACAVGWCGSLPEFQAEGFRIKLENGEAYPVWKHHTQWKAVEEFFELGRDSAHHLFSPDRYEEEVDPETEERQSIATPSDVADRIDELLGLDSTRNLAQKALLLV